MIDFLHIALGYRNTFSSSSGHSGILAFPYTCPRPYFQVVLGGAVGLLSLVDKGASGNMMSKFDIIIYSQPTPCAIAWLSHTQTTPQQEAHAIWTRLPSPRAKFTRLHPCHVINVCTMNATYHMTFLFATSFLIFAFKKVYF